MRFQLSTLRSLAGAASAVVPVAIAVHLAAEAVALGSGAIGAQFWLRHAYLLAPLALALWSFSRTVGLGRPRAEMVRRCALVRAQLRGGRALSTIPAFAAANLVFFGVTQLLEGDPIAAGSIGAGIVAAAIGSLAAALAVFVWGRPLAATALAAAVRRSRQPVNVLCSGRRIVGVSRSASSSFSLFVPNRPPPQLLPIVR